LHFGRDAGDTDLVFQPALVSILALSSWVVACDDVSVYPLDETLPAGGPSDAGTRNPVATDASQARDAGPGADGGKNVDAASERDGASAP
jgi:hypothetical protein